MMIQEDIQGRGITRRRVQDQSLARRGKDRCRQGILNGHSQHGPPPVGPSKLCGSAKNQGRLSHFMLGQQGDQFQRRVVPAPAHIDGQSKEFRMGRVDDFRVFPLFVLVRLPEAGPIYRRTPG